MAGVSGWGQAPIATTTSVAKKKRKSDARAAVDPGMDGTRRSNWRIADKDKDASLNDGGRDAMRRDAPSHRRRWRTGGEPVTRAKTATAPAAPEREEGTDGRDRRLKWTGWMDAHL